MKNVLISNDSTFSTALLLQSLHEKGDLITFADVYHGIWLPKKKATISSWKTEASRIEKILLPVIGHIPVKELTPHGLRSTARTWLRDQGCPNEVGEDFLAHVYGSPTERSYIRTDYLEQRKPFYVKWYEFLRYCWVLSTAYDNAYITTKQRSELDILIR